MCRWLSQHVRQESGQDSPRTVRTVVWRQSRQSRGSGCPDSPDKVSRESSYLHIDHCPSLGAGAKCWPVVRADVLSRSIEVPVLKEAVLKCETLLLALTPLLIVKVDVGALKLVFV